MLFGDRDELLTIIVCFNLLVTFNRNLIRIIDFSKCSLHLHKTIFSIYLTIINRRSNKTLLFESREGFLASTRENLHCKFEVLGHVQISSVLNSRRHLFFLELLIYLNGNRGGKDGSLNL